MGMRTLQYRYIYTKKKGHPTEILRGQQKGPVGGGKEDKDTSSKRKQNFVVEPEVHYKRRNDRKNKLLEKEKTSE